MTKELIILFLILSCNGIFGQTAQLNEYLSFLNNAGFSGQILVAEKGKILSKQSFGYTNKESLMRVTEISAFNIGSLTKQFTATAILLLEQNAKLKTTDPLGKYWDNLALDKKSITIHQLLTHTAGFGRQVIQTEEIISKNDLLKLIFTSKLIHIPGTIFQYSNSGYEVLAAIIEKVSGMPFTEFIRQNFIIPKQLSHTYFNTDDLYEINEQIAIGYNEWKEVNNCTLGIKNWNNTGASNILSTTEDLYKWFELIQSDKILNSAQKDKLFSPATTTDDEEEYGYGWFLTKTTTGKQLIYHGGDLSGYHTEFRYYPEDDRTIIILTNQELFGLAIFKYRIASTISKILSNIPVQFPLNTTKLKLDTLYKYCGTYQLDSANLCKIWMNGGQLTIGVSGQTAINLIVPKTLKAQLNLEDISEKSQIIMKAVGSGNDAIINQILSPKTIETFLPPLKEKYKQYSTAMDGNSEISITGTIPAYWRGDGISRTYIKLDFTSGSTSFYMGWNSKDLYDITVNDKRPFPLIYPLVFTYDNKSIIYDLDNANSTNIEFDKKISGIIKSLSMKDENGSKLLFKKIK
ncbi:MAG TPA: serine hydrolase domain-containing protein [Saprospiraceae bacterium]|nr:serine hydrolase domain-containing protein [Saprospiraceae bacterium]